MSWFSSLWRNLVHRERIERDLDDELRAAFELLVEEKLRAGMRPKDARRAALLELGGIESIKQQVRDVRAGALVDSLLRDIRHGVRVLMRGRLVTAIAVLTLALGIGANSAIFTLVNGLLLRPLPYPEVDRIVWIATTVATPENLDEWRAGLHSLERFAAFDIHSPVLDTRETTDLVDAFLRRVEDEYRTDVEPVLELELIRENFGQIPQCRSLVLDGPVRCNDHGSGRVLMLKQREEIQRAFLSRDTRFDRDHLLSKVHEPHSASNRFRIALGERRATTPSRRSVPQDVAEQLRR